MQLKNVACNYFLFACDMCNCIKQVAKDNFSISASTMPIVVRAMQIVVQATR